MESTQTSLALLAAEDAQEQGLEDFRMEREEREGGRGRMGE